MIRRIHLYLVLFLILFSTLDSGTDGSLYPFLVLSLASVLLLVVYVVAPTQDPPSALVESGDVTVPGTGDGHFGDRSGHRWRMVGCNATTLTFLLFAVWCAVSLVYTIDRPTTEYGLVRIFSSAVLVAVVPAAFSRREFQEIFWKTAVLWAAVLSLAGLAQLFFSVGGYGPRIHSFFVTPNTFAGYLLIPLPMAFALLRQARTSAEKRLWAACGVLTGAAFAATGSRGAWLAFLGAGVLWTAALVLTGRLTVKGMTTAIWHHRRWWVVVVLICTSILVFQVSRDRGMTERFLSLAHPLTAEPDRYRYWASTLEIMRTRPWLGYGLSTFRFVYVGYQSRDLGKTIQYYAHNDYLQMAAETGFVGLGLFLLLSALVALLGWRALRRGEGPLAVALTLGLWGILLHSFVDFDFHIPAIQTLFWLGVAYLLTAGNGVPHGPDTPVASLAHRQLLCGAVILLAGYVSGTVVRNFFAERASAHGFLLVQQQDLGGARRRFTDAVRLVPYSSYHLAGLARVAILEGEAQKNQPALRDAEHLLQRALALNPYDLDTRILLAQMYSRNLDLLGGQTRPRLLAVLEEGIALLPNVDLFRHQLGRVLLEGGEPARAVDQLERYLARRPRDTTVRLLLAQAYSRSGRPGEAEVQAREILTLDPENVRARAILTPPAPP